MMIKNLLKIEEFFLFLLSIYLFTRLDFPWWIFLVLFLLPDLGMLGYLINKKAGAFFYNLVHHKAISVSIWIIGAYISDQTIQLIGIILLAHSSLDRVFSYGLKYPDDFKHTHLS